MSEPDSVALRSLRARHSPTGLERAGSPGEPYLARLLFLALLAGTLVASGCMLEPPEERVLQISLDVADQPVAVGDSTLVHFAAEGPRLAVIRVFFGDGQADSLGGASALTVSGTMTHVFQEAGAFEVVGEVEGIDGRTAEDRLMLEVVPGSDG